MEQLRLFFDEIIIRKLYEDSFIERQNAIVSKIKASNQNTVVIIVGILFVFSVANSQNSISMYYLSGVLTVIGFLYSFSRWISSRKALNSIKKEREDLENWILEHIQLRDIRYKYDDIKIEYYKDFILDSTFEWRNMVQTQKYSEFLYMFFQNEKLESMLLPFDMLDNVEFAVFEEFVKQKAKELKVDFLNV